MSVRSVADWALAGTVTAIEFSDMFVFGSGRRGLLDAILLLASALPLAGWRRSPFWCLQVTGAATIALAYRHATHAGLGPIACTYAVACWASGRGRRVAAALLAVAVWLVPLLTDDRGSIPTNAALFAAAWILGMLMRERREQNEQLRIRAAELAREREEKAALAADAERSRIARELHDVLTHSVSVMVIQAQGAQASGNDHDRVMAALQRIETIGRGALSELRGLLRDTDTPRVPQPGFDRIGELAQAVRDAGVTVTLDGPPPAGALPASVELSAYRIVQEALTNTLRHSASASARVTVRREATALVVDIEDDGPARARTGAAPGRGITGMRQRAAIAGGTLTAGSEPHGGFHVTARLPVPEHR
jgi:signal transduction histidine kinase